MGEREGPARVWPTDVAGQPLVAVVGVRGQEFVGLHPATYDRGYM